MEINIYYSADNGRKNYMMTFLSIISLCESNKNNDITIYLLNCEYKNFCKKLTSQQLENIRNYVSNINNKNKVIVIDISTLLVEKFHISKQKWNGCPKPIIWARHLLPFIKNVNFPSKLLWLDSDTLVLRDLTNLFNIDISNVSWAGATDDWWNGNGKKLNKKIIQNGVMLLNTEKVFHYMKNLVERERRLKIFDDMVKFNKITFTDKKTINRDFNNFGAINADTYIFHVCGVFTNSEKKYSKILQFFKHLYLSFKYGFKNMKKIDLAFERDYGKNNNIDECLKTKIYSYEDLIKYFPKVISKKGKIKTSDENEFLACYPQFKYIYDIFHSIENKNIISNNERN